MNHQEPPNPPELNPTAAKLRALSYVTLGSWMSLGTAIVLSQLALVSGLRAWSDLLHSASALCGLAGATTLGWTWSRAIRNGATLAEALGRIRREVDAELPGRASATQRSDATAAVRRALEERRWEDARERAESAARDHASDPEMLRLPDMVAHALSAAVSDLRAKLEAARSVNDPDTVLILHAELTALLPGTERPGLERQTLDWLVRLVQKRMRTGTVRTDVAILAGKIADHFGHTVEGASLRASLPILRRSSGLCPKCGNPYAGLGDACPDCLGIRTPAAPDDEPDVDMDAPTPDPLSEFKGTDDGDSADRPDPR